MRKLCGLDRFAGSDYWGLKPDMPISELRTHHIAELRAERAEEGLKANSINIEIRYIQRVYNLCYDEWDYDVFAGVKFKMLKGFEKSRYLSYEEEEQVLDILKEPSIAKKKAANLMIFLLDTGVRLQEALNVTWQDIDFANKTIEVYRGKTSTLSAVPMSNRVEEMLLEQQEVHDEPFPSMDKAVKHLRSSINEICNTDKRIIEQRGSATIHSLRDTFASRLTQQGLSLHKISKLLGHSSTTMTRKYAHLESGATLEQARDLLNQ
jgi:integrase